MEQNTDKNLIAGIDDATKCPCIGSIFIAGVLASEETIHHWKEIGVKDSKLIASKKRARLAKIIKETAVHYYITEITPEIMQQTCFNLNDWEMLTILKIITNLQKAGDPQAFIIDNWEVTEKLFFKRFRMLLKLSMKRLLVAHHIRLNRKKLRSAHIVPEHYADENHTIVGAASILAKTSSELQYKKYKRIYGDFGSGSPADPATRLFVWHHRLNPPPIIRTTWQTFKTLQPLDSIEDDPFYKYKSKITEKQQ